MHALTGTLAAATMLLYGGVALADNPSPSMLDESERATALDLIPEDMGGFVLHDEPRPFRDKTFLDPEEKDVDLSAFDGTLSVVNFWATWCTPCRRELPYFDDLKADLAEDGVRVVTISLDKGGRNKAAGYLEGKGLDLPAYSDPKANLSRQMGILGLPVTAILGPDGREIGRLTGDAKWNSPEAKDWLRHLASATDAAAATPAPSEPEARPGLLGGVMDKLRSWWRPAS